MVEFFRNLRVTAFVLITVAIIAALRALDAALGTGRFLFGLGVGLLLGVGGIVAFSAHRHRKAQKMIRLRAPPMETEPAASYDWKVAALDGTTFSMENAKGEILFLNISSSTCAASLAEFASIERLQRALASDAIKFMCVATDRDANRVRKFVEAHGWKLPFFVLADRELPQVFDSDYLPATYVVSPDGLVVYKHTGAAMWDDPRVVSFLRGLSVHHRLLHATVQSR